MAADPGTPPSITTRGKAGFSDQVSAFITWLISFYAWIVDVKNAFTFNAISGTSTTSITIGAGAKSLTTQASKSFLPGQAISVARTSSPTNYEVGIVTSYNSGSGALNYTVPTGAISGSGTYTDWTISIASYAQLTANAVTAQYLADSSQGFSMINGELILAAPSGNAQTLSLKTLAGTDPSVSDPVLWLFRDTTAGSGVATVVEITSALSLTISSGSTLGMVANQAARIYVTGHNNGGVGVLGVYNPLDSTNNLLGLDESILMSTTAEGGAGAADSAQVIYTASALTTKPFRILGYFESTQATPGTWLTAASKVQLMGIGVKKTGDVVQVKRTDVGTFATGTTLIPNDNTIPQNTEGTQFMSLAITPVASPNLLKVSAAANMSNSATSRVMAALFRDSAANAISASANVSAGSTLLCEVCLQSNLVANQTTSTTFKVNGGSQTAGTTTFNGESGAQIFGGVMNSFIEITEVHV